MQHRDGFTLIELLVVIAIISLLVSILIPSLHKAKELATSLLCQTHLKALGTGFNYYMTDWDGYLPPVNAVIGYNAQSAYTKPYGMVNCLGRYFDHPEWEDDWYNFGAIKKEFRKTVFVCPVRETAEAWKSGYCESVYLQEPGGFGANNPRAWAFPRPHDEITNPSNSVHLADGNGWHLNNVSKVGISTSFDLTRHMEGTNVLFADSHVDHYGEQSVINNINDDFELP